MLPINIPKFTPNFTCIDVKGGLMVKYNFFFLSCHKSENEWAIWGKGSWGSLYIKENVLFTLVVTHIYILCTKCSFFFYTRCFSQNFRNFKHDVQFPYLLKTRNEYLCSRYINMWELVWGNFPKNRAWSCIWQKCSFKVVFELRFTQTQLHHCLRDCYIASLSFNE